MCPSYLFSGVGCDRVHFAYDTGQSCEIKHLLDWESHNKIEFDKAKTQSDALITIQNSPVTNINVRSASTRIRRKSAGSLIDNNTRCKFTQKPRVS